LPEQPFAPAKSSHPSTDRIFAILFILKKLYSVWRNQTRMTFVIANTSELDFISRESASRPKIDIACR
jgi:hypothetical protein